MFSNEFSLAKQDIDFAWVRKEAKDFGIGVLIDVFPYTDQNVFDEQNILDRLDTIMKRHVPASAENSYMGIERRRDEAGNYLAPIYSKRQVEFDSDYCIETRGSWRSFGDFMAGPFVNYTFLSPNKKKVIMLTGYVYCPRNKPWTKRDLLMQVESICWSLQWTPTVNRHLVTCAGCCFSFFSYWPPCPSWLRISLPAARWVSLAGA